VDRAKAKGKLMTELEHLHLKALIMVSIMDTVGKDLPRNAEGLKQLSDMAEVILKQETSAKN
jgi:hypothetical protein